MSKRWWRPARLVFLTVHEDADFARAALDAGGLGYVVKARLASDLLRETSRLARGQSIVITQRAHSAALIKAHEQMQVAGEIRRSSRCSIGSPAPGNN
jgi:DNA-binding NarL/FixJ family response regulator